MAKKPAMIPAFLPAYGNRLQEEIPGSAQNDMEERLKYSSRSSNAQMHNDYLASERKERISPEASDTGSPAISSQCMRGSRRNQVI